MWRGGDASRGDDEGEDDEDEDNVIDVAPDNDENTYKVVCEDWLPNSQDRESST